MSFLYYGVIFTEDVNGNEPNTSIKEFGMDIFTKYLEEIISYRTVDNAMLDTLFETNNVPMESRIAIMKKYVGIQCYAYVDSKSKILEELYETLKTMIRAIKKHRPPVEMNKGGLT